MPVQITMHALINDLLYVHIMYRTLRSGTAWSSLRTDMIAIVHGLGALNTWLSEQASRTFATKGITYNSSCNTQKQVWSAQASNDYNDINIIPAVLYNELPESNLSKQGPNNVYVNNSNNTSHKSHQCVWYKKFPPKVSYTLTIWRIGLFLARVCKPSHRPKFFKIALSEKLLLVLSAWRIT